MFQTDRVVWDVSIYWLALGVYVDEMVWGNFISVDLKA